MHMWIFLVCLFSVIKGIREILKKKALEKNPIEEILFFYTFLGLIFVLPTCDKSVFEISGAQLLLVFAKSCAVFVAWICSFIAIRNVPISFCGVMDLSRIIFSTLLAILVLGERMSVPNIIGFFIVLAGVLMVNFKWGTKSESTNPKYAFMLLLSCFFNAISGIIDKTAMKELNSTQVQLWYMLFLTILYLTVLLIKQRKVNFKTLKTNFWIPLLSIIFVIGDKALFIANADPASKVSIMTLIKQSSVFVVVILGKLVYKDKNIAYKLFCAGVVLLGVLISLM